MQKVSSISAVIAVLFTAMASGLIGSAVAASSTIYGCVSKTGTLSKISYSSHACPKYTSKISWGTQGITGLQGIMGEQGLRGEPGPQGIRGEKGADGSGLIAYAAEAYGEIPVKTYVDDEIDYSIVSTTNTLPIGPYFVSANASFRLSAGIRECLISVDATPRLGQIRGLVQGAPSVAISGIVWVTQPSKISLACYATTDFNPVANERHISVIKISDLNPEN